jgi:LEA14-like dessication related protein
MTKMKKILAAFVLAGLWAGCAPKEAVQFRSVKNIVVDVGQGDPLVTGDALFYNPNKMRMKVKEINLEVLVDGKKAATVNDHPDLAVPAQAEFTVPVKAKLSLKELGLLDTLFSLLGGKKYELRYVGYIRVAVHGVTVKVPVNHRDEVKLRL